uniref:Small CPxCG-related zinc finger protein n=1 Tax=Pseudomonas phage HRDY3 TaxID=3236930 RepID=A0AB39CEH5_9VIRU
MEEQEMDMEREEDCPACRDVTDDDPFYGECLACGALDTRVPE